MLSTFLLCNIWPKACLLFNPFPFEYFPPKAFLFLFFVFVFDTLFLVFVLHIVFCFHLVLFRILVVYFFAWLVVLLEYTADSYNKNGKRDNIEKTWIEEFQTEKDRNKIYETIKLMPETYKNIKRYEQSNAWREYLAK